MTLPSFTITGTLFDLLGNVAAGEIIGNGLGGATPATVTFTSNVPQGYFVTFGGVAYRVDEVTGIVNSNGTITHSGDPVQLLANDAGLSIDGLQWQCHVAGMHRFWFNAPVDGGTVNLGTVAPVPGIGVGGVAFSEGELITLLADGTSPVRVALDALYMAAGSNDEYHEYANLAAFPGTGVADRIYVALDTGKFYRWSGSAYAQIAGNAATALKLFTARNINGVAFDGTADITVVDATKQPLVKDAGAFPWPQGLVALWDFQRDTAGGTTLTSLIGSQVATLTAMGSKTVVKDASDPGPFGPSLVLDGATMFFKSGGLGALDVSAWGDEVTVITLVKDTANNYDDTGSGTAFRAGSHNDGSSPSRQYGSYFGAGGFIGHHAHYTPHIGAQDGPSPGYPYNRDQAASHRKLHTPTGQGQWHMEAFTFNGQELTAFIDGMTDSWTSVPEPDPAYFSLSPGAYTPQIVDRNPYPLKKGINRSQTTKIFTIGGSPVQTPPTTGINFTTGKLGFVAVFNRALTPKEVMQIRLGTLLSGEAITSFGFEVSSTGAHYLNEIGWAAGGGAANVHVGSLTSTGPEFAITRPVSGSKAYLQKTSTTIGATWGPVSGLNSAQLARIRFKLMSAATTGAPVRLLVKVGSQWWASNTTYATTGAHAGDTDWTGAETKTLAVDWGIGNWKPVTISDIGGTATYQNLAKDPTLSTGSTGWFKGSAAAGATAARVSDGAGGFVWRTTWTGTDVGSIGFAGLAFGSIGAITAGNVYAASILASPSKPQALNLQMLWINAGGSLISTTDGGAFIVGANTPATLPVAGTAPALATGLTLRAQSVYPPAVPWVSGDTCDLSKALVVAGPLLPAAFDGASALAAWDGTAGASTSTITGVATGTLSLGGSTNAAWIDNALITAVGFLSSGGDGSAVRITDLELLPS